MPACLLEDVVEVGLGVADIGVEDVGDRYRQEPGSHLTGHGAGDEGLARPRRAVQEQAAAQALAVEPAQLGIAHRGQERRLQPVLDLSHAADVGQADAGPLHLPVRGGAGVVGLDRTGLGESRVGVRGPGGLRGPRGHERGSRSAAEVLLGPPPVEVTGAPGAVWRRRAGGHWSLWRGGRWGSGGR